MALMWFSIFLMPIFQIGASAGLVTLYFVNGDAAWALFRGFWIVSALVYLFITLTSLAIDSESARKSAVEGLAFPGLVALGINAYALFPFALDPLVARLDLDADGVAVMVLTLVLYAWLTLAMAVSWTAKQLEGTRHFGWAAPIALWIGGYGSFLCAVTFGSYVKELRGAAMTWDKTEKTGKVSTA